MLDELQSHGILTWQPVDDEMIQLNLIHLDESECKRLYLLLSPAAQAVWNHLAQDVMRAERLERARRN